MVKLFVVNRVVETLEYTDISVKQHVPSHDNPADVMSRGLHSFSLVSASLWWTGPDFMQLSLENWPMFN